MVERLCIIGLGLIGGSLAKALRRHRAVREVVATGRRATSLETGLELGVIDRWTLDLEKAVRGADMVVIATPTLVAERVLEQLAPLMHEGMVVTDVASVKGNLLRAAQGIFGERLPGNLVLGHPIAGSEQSGVEAARADLFVDHRVILTPQPETDAGALAAVESMWRTTGAEVVRMGVAEHDAVLAATSHLPHALAYALVDALARSSASEQIFRFAAGGFRDFTRIASSDPQMWHDIVLANREAVLSALDDFEANLVRLRTAIDRGDSDVIMELFGNAKRSRDRHLVFPRKPTKDPS